MKQVLIRQGQATIEEVPPPIIEKGRVLVQVRNSCISIGTEMSGLKASGLPLWKKALKQPKNIIKVAELIKSQGISKTKNLIESKISGGHATGYSASGIVIGIGEEIEDLKVGDFVACAGAQYAHHAEVISVPRNLIALMPPAIDFEDACTVTLGAIALQGIRRAQPTLGETFVVVGLGILGQLTAQMLRINGCKVIGVDIIRERIHLAQELGMHAGIDPQSEEDIQRIERLTDGYGADGVIITAANSSNEIISKAFQMCRKKGRVVLVGDVGLNLNRSDFYAKEIDFFISTSYGPGRYDNNYEERGLDYPIAYVRWTENRNMMEYLRLISSGLLQIKPLLNSIYPIENAFQAYESLKPNENNTQPILVLLSYSDKELTLCRKIINPKATPSHTKRIRIAVAGAGGFAKGVHLPNLRILDKEFELKGIMSKTGHNAVATAKQFGAQYSTTDYEEILADKNVDAILIASRHNLHADMVIKALNAGKHVLVEKPLTLTIEELEAVQNFYDCSNLTEKPILLTGFNRRFSPYAQQIKQIVEQRSNPMIINYQMNAGYLPQNHWVYSLEGGGRNIGEACHIYDLFTFLIDAQVTHIQVSKIKPATQYYSSLDNFVATINFQDGSVATLTYTALGSNQYPKEIMQIYIDGKVISLKDYKKLSITGAKQKIFATKTQDKGLKSELMFFAESLKSGNWAIPLWQQIQSTKISLIINDLLTEKDIIKNF